VGLAATRILGRRVGALAGATGALLLVRLASAAGHLGPVLGLVCALPLVAEIDVGGLEKSGFAHFLLEVGGGKVDVLLVGAVGRVQFRLSHFASSRSPCR